MNQCRAFLKEEVTHDELITTTIRLGFVNVVDAFQSINGDIIKDPFYEKNYIEGLKEIILTDNISKLKESIQFSNLDLEVDARWSLVETAWNLNLNPKLLEVKHDSELQQLFIESSFMQRINITSVRDSLNGYQKVMVKPNQ